MENYLLFICHQKLNIHNIKRIQNNVVLFILGYMVWLAESVASQIECMY